jgi:inner membrane protein
MPYWIWFVCGTSLLIIEIIAPHLMTIWFALAALLTGVVAYWIGDTTTQLAFFAASSMVSFSIGWFWLRKSMSMNLRPKGGKDSILGEAGTIVSADAQTPCSGRVRFQGPVQGDEVWEFTSEDPINAGDRCVVTEVVGARVKVKKA